MRAAKNPHQERGSPPRSHRAAAHASSPANRGPTPPSAAGATRLARAHQEDGVVAGVAVRGEAVERGAEHGEVLLVVGDHKHVVPRGHVIDVQQARALVGGLGHREAALLVERLERRAAGRARHDARAELQHGADHARRLAEAVEQVDAREEGEEPEDVAARDKRRGNQRAERGEHEHDEELLVQVERRLGRQLRRPRHRGLVDLAHWSLSGPRTPLGGEALVRSPRVAPFAQAGMSTPGPEQACGRGSPVDR